MTSWANMNSSALKKKEVPIPSFFSTSSTDYSEATLSFLYSYIYTQRTAEPFYIYDTNGFFQPLLATSPVLHYLKEQPKSSRLLTSAESDVQSVLKPLSLQYLRRNATSILQYNGETDAKIKAFLTTAGLQQKVFDVAIVLDTSGCFPSIFTSLEQFQKRIGKKTLDIFVMTDNLDFIKEFATKGNSSWSYTSLFGRNQTATKEQLLIKTLAELRIVQRTEWVAVRFGSAIGKLIYLTNKSITSESQILSLDGQSWKVF